MKTFILFAVSILFVFIPVFQASAAFIDPCEQPDPPDSCSPSEEGRDPVIIIPGIVGSWNWKELFGGSGGTWTSIPFYDIYKPLFDALVDEGYEEGKDLFIAYYDWRQPNVISARDYLKPVIDQAKTASGSDSVDVIAHSMGGIVLRAYVQGSQYEYDVDQVFTLGTPHYGSGDVYALWEGGTIPTNWNLMQRYLFSAYFRYNKVFNPVQRYNFVHTNLTSLRDLLPTYDYLTDINTNNVKPVGSMQEQNTTLAVLNSSLWKLFSSVDALTTIAGYDVPTVSTILVEDRDPAEAPLWADGKPFPENPPKGSTEGDDRVLLSSAHAQRIVGDLLTLPGAKHGELPSRAATPVFSRLGLADPGEVAAIEEPESILAYWIASPVAPRLTNPLGNVISPDTSTMPDATYFAEDDPLGKKMIVIPNPIGGGYMLELTGLDAGSYDLAIAYFKENTPETIHSFTGTVNPGTKINYWTRYDDTNPEDPFTTVVFESTLASLREKLDYFYQKGDIRHVSYYVLRTKLDALDQLLASRAAVADLPHGLNRHIANLLDQFVSTLERRSGRGVASGAAELLNMQARSVKAVLGV